jgi:hypothetical protein
MALTQFFWGPFEQPEALIQSAQITYDMIQRTPPTSKHQFHSFAALMQRLGETFVVRDVMVHLAQIEYVAPGDGNAANRIVAEKRYSVVPASADGQNFETAPSIH